MNNIRDEILNSLPTPESFLSTNFRVPKKLIDEYGSDEFNRVLEEMEKADEIYWCQLNQYSTVIKRTRKSFQTVNKK
ncbi:MAG: hypothetical protein NTX61_01520 [Bacteroidetes bacterium]|nr:hypothetical protein [Bacteroidota bacterium]